MPTLTPEQFKKYRPKTLKKALEYRDQFVPLDGAREMMESPRPEQV